jgi:hypothetical protein
MPFFLPKPAAQLVKIDRRKRFAIFPAKTPISLCDFGYPPVYCDVRRILSKRSKNAFAFLARNKIPDTGKFDYLAYAGAKSIPADKQPDIKAAPYVPKPTLVLFTFGLQVGAGNSLPKTVPFIFYGVFRKSQHPETLPNSATTSFNKDLDFPHTPFALAP